MRRVVLAVFLVLVVPAPASAFTIMINGDTPSVHYQHWADDFGVPLPFDDTMNLRIAACPNGWRGACVHHSSIPATAWVPPVDAYRMRRSLAHEIGHVFQARAQPAMPHPERFAEQYEACAIRELPSPARPCWRIHKLYARLARQLGKPISRESREALALGPMDA